MSLKTTRTRTVVIVAGGYHSKLYSSVNTKYFLLYQLSITRRIYYYCIEIMVGQIMLLFSRHRLTFPIRLLYTIAICGSVSLIY